MLATSISRNCFSCTVASLRKNLPTTLFLTGSVGFPSLPDEDKRKLTQQELLENQERSWKLTPIGRKAANVLPTIRMRMDRFAKVHAHLRGDDLVAEAYRRYPYYAIRSEIAERVLAGDKLASMAIAAARPTAPKAGIVTIGYEQRTLESYLNCLLQAGVTLLCDVRRNAFSHKYGFSKTYARQGLRRGWNPISAFPRIRNSIRRTKGTRLSKRLRRSFQNLSAGKLTETAPSPGNDSKLGPTRTPSCADLL